MSEVWGIGGAPTERLARLGIACVRYLRDAPHRRISEHFTVVMERTVAELNGVACVGLESVTPAKQEIVSSRSFGRPVRTLEELGEAVLSYAARAAQKLREQACTTHLLCTFLETSPFQRDAPQFHASRVMAFHDATDDTLAIGRGVLAALRRAYRPGYDYKKAGVLLAAILPRCIATRPCSMIPTRCSGTIGSTSRWTTSTRVSGAARCRSRRPADARRGA